MSDCENQPCLNSGQCFDEPFRKSYRCECRKGWMGKHCETKTVTCAEKPCVYGTCKDTAMGFMCACPQGYSGVYCDVQIDECNPNPCENGAACTNKGDSFVCACPLGFTGLRCETNINDCDGSPCLNGGSCIDMINQFRCQCVPGFIGTTCAEKVDLCLTKPCANGGSCINLNNDYKCTCRPGFTGKDCSIDIDECSSHPCKNGGTCVNRVNSFQCVCPGGFRGYQCEDEAASNSNYDATHISTTQAYSRRSDGLSKGQVALIAILSVAMPMVVIVAACVVYCMKRKRKRDQEKDDAEARKQNERNASATLHHGNSVISSKRSSSTNLPFDNSNPTIIKNTWDKSVNNISSSASVDDCLMNGNSCYGAMTNYTDNDCFTTTAVSTAQIPPLQRAKSQKQLNTDPMLMHRASQVIHSKDYLMDQKRISCIGNLGNSNVGGAGSLSSNGIPSDSTYCNSNSNQRWQTTPHTQTTTTSTTMSSPQRQYGLCSPSHM